MVRQAFIKGRNDPLEFPDETSDEVIQRTVKQYTGAPQTETPTPTLSDAWEAAKDVSRVVSPLGPGIGYLGEKATEAAKSLYGMAPESVRQPVEKGLEFLQKPLVEFKAPEKPGLLDPLLKEKMGEVPYESMMESAKGLSEVAHGLTSPMNLGLAAATAVDPAVAPYAAAAFTPGMVGGGLEELGQGWEAIKSGEYPKAAGQITKGGLSLAAGLLGAREFGKMREVAPVGVDPIQAELAAAKGAASAIRLPSRTTETGLVPYQESLQAQPYSPTPIDIPITPDRGPSFSLLSRLDELQKQREANFGPPITEPTPTLLDTMERPLSRVEPGEPLRPLTEIEETKFSPFESIPPSIDRIIESPGNVLSREQLRGRGIIDVSQMSTSDLAKEYAKARLGSERGSFSREPLKPEELEYLKNIEGELWKRAKERAAKTGEDIDEAMQQIAKGAKFVPSSQQRDNAKIEKAVKITDKGGWTEAPPLLFDKVAKTKGHPMQSVATKIRDDLLNAKKNFVDQQIGRADEYQNFLSKDLGFKQRELGKFGELAQKVYEGVIPVEDVIKSKGQDYANKLIAHNDWMKQKYDEGITRLQESQRANGVPEDRIVQPRKNYMRHMQEEGGFWSGIKDLTGQQPDDAMFSKDIPKYEKSLSILKRRTGKETKYDAVQGYLDWQRQAAYEQHVNPVAKNMKNTINQLMVSPLSPDEIIAHKQSKSDLYKRAAAKIEDTSNDMTTVDNVMQQMAGDQNRVNHGRFLDFVDRTQKVLSGDLWHPKEQWQRSGLNLYNRVLGGIVGKNVGTAFTHSTLSLAAILPEAGPMAYLKGLKRTIADTSGKHLEGDSYYDSLRYKERTQLGDIKDKFDPKWAKGTRDSLRNFSAGVDEFANHVGWNSLYEKYKSQGVANPARQADIDINRIIPGRSVAERAHIYEPLGGAQTFFQKATIPFTMEIMRHLKNVVGYAKDKSIYKLALWAAAQYAGGSYLRATTGRAHNPDMINAISEAFGPEMEDEPWYKKMGRIGGEALKGVPAASTAVHMALPESTRRTIFGKDDPGRYGSVATKLTDIGHPLATAAYWTLGPGARQAIQSASGIQDLVRGYHDMGQYETPIEPSLLNIMRGVAFGPEAFSEVKQARHMK